MKATLITTWISLTLLAIFTRVAPLIGGEWLRRQKWVERVASQLPCMILLLLLIHDMEARAARDLTNLFPTTLGLGATFLCQGWKRQTVLSIAVGVATYIAGLALMKFYG